MTFRRIHQKQTNQTTQTRPEKEVTGFRPEKEVISKRNMTRYVRGKNLSNCSTPVITRKKKSGSNTSIDTDSADSGFIDLSMENAEATKNHYKLKITPPSPPKIKTTKADGKQNQLWSKPPQPKKVPHRSPTLSQKSPKLHEKRRAVSTSAYDEPTTHSGLFFNLFKKKGKLKYIVSTFSKLCCF